RVVPLLTRTGDFEVAIDPLGKSLEISRVTLIETICPGLRLLRIGVFQDLLKFIQKFRREDRRPVIAEPDLSLTAGQQAAHIRGGKALTAFAGRGETYLKRRLAGRG